MHKLIYCPKCGEKTLHWDFEKKLNCSNCDFTLFHNIAGAVAVIIRHENSLFFTKRNQEPKKGLLDLSGGFVDPKESAEQTCARELKEELQINIDPSLLKYLGSLPNVYHYQSIDYQTIDLFYEYKVLEKFDVIMEISEISETLWIDMNDINLNELAFESQKKFLKSYLKNN